MGCRVLVVAHQPGPGLFEPPECLAVAAYPVESPGAQEAGKIGAMNKANLTSCLMRFYQKPLLSRMRFSIRWYLCRFQVLLCKSAFPQPISDPPVKPGVGPQTPERIEQAQEQKKELVF